MTVPPSAWHAHVKDKDLSFIATLRRCGDPAGSRNGTKSVRLEFSPELRPDQRQRFLAVLSIDGEIRIQCQHRVFAKQLRHAHDACIG